MKVGLKENFDLRESPIPLVFMDKDHGILQFSTGLLDFFELPKSHVPKKMDDLFGELPLGLTTCVNNNLEHVEIIPLVSKKGKQRWIKVSLFPLGNGSTGFQVFFDDVTEDKEHYELALEAKKIAKIGSWKVDLIKNSIFWSKITKTIHEVPSDFEPDLEKGINFYKEGEHRERIVEAVSACIESGKPFDVELIIVTAKGNEKWVRSIGEAERSNGKTIGFYGVFQDIDEIKREKLKNEELNNRMRAAVQSAQIGIWDWDVVNNHLIWDDNMFTIFDIDRDEFKEAYKAWESALHPEDKERATHEVELALEGKKDFDTVFRIRKQDGSIAHIQGRAQVFRDGDGKPRRMVGINADVTKLKRKDERLRKLLDLTEKQNQKLLNFAQIVSHNLRSNSSNISMLSGMLLSNIVEKERDKFLDMIHTSSERLEETLNQLNEIIRIQETRYSDLHEVKVLPILENVLERINATIAESKAEVRIDMPKAIRVIGVAPYLTSIFMNLLTNSIKYKSPQRALKINIKAEILGNRTVIGFEDNGLGIDLEKNAKNLFGMYKTFHNNEDAKGVGLFISKNQMEAMNGKIEVRSTVNKGSTFYLYFTNNE